MSEAQVIGIVAIFVVAAVVALALKAISWAHTHALQAANVVAAANKVASAAGQAASAVEGEVKKL